MWKAISALALGLLWPQDPVAPATAWQMQTDVSSVLRTWRIKGTLVCPHKGRKYPCLWVENAFPCGLIELVRRSRASQVLEAAGWTKALPEAGGHGEAGLRYLEARVLGAVPQLLSESEFPIARPRAQGTQVHYLSELDRTGWRKPAWDRLLKAPFVPRKLCERNPAQPGCAGIWGSLYPRTGFVEHPSEGMAAALLAMRAGRVASDPPGRVTLAPYPYEPRVGHHLQMIRPQWRPGTAMGYPVAPDLFAGSATGSYLFVHLGIFEECRRCLSPRLVGPR